MKATRVPPTPVEGKVTLELSDTEVRNLSAILGRVYGNSEFVEDLYRALYDLDLRGSGSVRVGYDKRAHGTDNVLFVRDKEDN